MSYPAPDFDVLAIGNAIVDVIATAHEDFLEERGMIKDSMRLIDTAEAEDLYGAMGPGTEASGGSAANTAAGLAALGARAAFIGKVRNDQLGGIFAHDIRAVGVHFDTEPATEGPPTARCLILVTPDGHRTMNTYLGASAEFGPGDVDTDLVKRAGITYLEGYLWDRPEAKQAFELAARTANEAGRKVALSLSDPFCVDRHRADFQRLVDGHVDILFANEQEAISLYQTEDFDSALQGLRGKCEVLALTRSEHGSVLVSGEEVHVIEAMPVNAVVDTTGAGDLYAAGVLHGLAFGKSLHDAGKIGAIAASECIGHFGPRPIADLKALVAEMFD